MITFHRERVRRLLLLLPLLGAGCATVEMDAGQLLSPGVDQRQNALAVAAAAYEAGRPSEAMAEYARVLSVDPQDEVARLGVADCYIAVGAAKQASLAYGSLLSSEVPMIRNGAQQGRGLSLLMLGDLDSGHAQLLQVVSDDPSLWRSWNALGWSYDKKRDWVAADDAYRRAAELSPTPHLVFNNWGMSLLAQGNAGAAAAKFKRAIELRPDLDVARTNLQVALGLQGKYREALAASGQQHMPAALNNVGYAAMLRGDSHTAEQYFARAVEESPRFNRAAWKNLKYMTETSME